MSSHSPFIHFGKHNGKTFDWIAINDREYFEWFLTQPSLKGNLRRKIQAALDRNPIQEELPEIISKEQREAMDELVKTRKNFLDFELPETY